MADRMRVTSDMDESIPPACGHRNTRAEDAHRERQPVSLGFWSAASIAALVSLTSPRRRGTRPSVARNGLGFRPVEVVFGGVRHPHLLPVIGAGISGGLATHGVHPLDVGYV